MPHHSMHPAEMRSSPSGCISTSDHLLPHSSPGQLPTLPTSDHDSQLLSTFVKSDTWCTCLGSDSLRGDATLGLCQKVQPASSTRPSPTSYYRQPSRHSDAKHGVTFSRHEYAVRYVSLPPISIDADQLNHCKSPR